MDWTLALNHNQAILLRNVAWLFSWLGLEVGGSVARLPRFKRRTILFVLRPSESACRRLILVAIFVLGTKAVVLPERAARPVPAKPRVQGTARGRATAPSFKLIDPRKNFDLNPNKPKRAKGPGPWVTDLWSDDPIYDRSALYAYQERLNQPPEEDASAEALCHRLNALMGALNDLPAQAQRMVRLQARAERRWKNGGKPNLSAMRPGLPPGYRQRHKHEVDEVLSECHTLAKWALREAAPPDTS